MGEPSPKISHFSHGHPLELTTCQRTHTTSFCSGCTQNLSGWGKYIYTCRSCNSSLHLSCAQAPHLIHHPAHPNHPLPLLPRPSYPNGSFNCNACDSRGTGFSNHCVACNKLDLHVHCVSVMPLSRHYQAHQVCNGFAPPNPLAQGPPVQFQHHQQHQMPPMVAPGQFQGGGQGSGHGWGGVVAGGLVGGTAQGAPQGLVEGVGCTLM